jgi:hypothetical protein
MLPATLAGNLTDLMQAIQVSIAGQLTSLELAGESV